MRKLIFVEGMDNTGKDTQIKNICNHFPTDNFHTLHYHAIKSRTAEESRKMHEALYEEAFELANVLPNHNIIFNRSHYGEYVYGKLYRDYDNPGYVFSMEREPQYSKLFEEAVLIVFVTTDYQALASREDGDSLSQGDLEFISREHHRFTSVYELSAINPMRKILINTAGCSKEQVWNAIQPFLDSVYNDS